MHDWRNRFRHKLVTAGEAVKAIKSGDRVVIAHACGEPQALVAALVARAPELTAVEIVHMVAMGPAKYAQPGMEQSFRHNALFVGGSTRKAVAERRADYTPCFFSEVPRLFRGGLLPVDAALIQVTPPDADGYCSFGVSVDYTREAAQAAKTVIAQMNRKLPRTGGARIPLAELDYIVEQDEPLLELTPPAIGETEERIGRHIASLIPDGATLQMGIGAIPDAALLFLKDKRDLGIHSEMFSDGVVALAEAGVITNNKKAINTGKFMATFLMGSRKLYDFIDNNPAVELQPVDYINDPCVIGKHAHMIAINSALQVDLMGQVNAETIGGRQFSGIGGQVDFIRGAARSEGGKSIIALPATAAGGKLSRIVCRLERGAAVSTTRNDVHYVVTEYGIAQLRGKSLRQRAQALIAISHPAFRDDLEKEAAAEGLL
ncbi:MAG: acetyl-CoA hydrolase/transferase C-terminal domain-containing protein [Sporomusaceae bacterium]|nr:acetyl-CoA hydrolase/transferase C-terminal domain-containing protein [Sporomusaceae bacterium]